TTLVGTPYSRLVHAGWGSHRRSIRRRGARNGRDERPHAGSGRARHVVLLSALALLNSRLAQRNGRPENFLSHVSARNGSRHHLSVGLAHGDGGFEVRWQRTVRRCI